MGSGNRICGSVVSHPASKIIDTDVVIVGAESTGLTAAVVCAKNPSIRVSVLTKGESIGRTGATMLAHEPLSSCVLDSQSAHDLIGLKRGDPRDNPSSFFEDIVTYGDFVNDQELVNIIVKRSAPIAKEFTNWGFKWNYDVVDRSPGHRYPRDYYGDHAWGPEYLKLGSSLLRERRNVEIYADTMAIDLLTQNGKISGIACIDIQSGSLVVFKARAVILAAGGCQNVYSHVTTGRELTGDAFAMAYRAGAELMDLE